jgi:hypothetical protein
MEKVKELLGLLARGRLVVTGKGNTFVKAPLWLAVIAALFGRHALRFAVLTAVGIVAFGMQVRVER